MDYGEMHELTERLYEINKNVDIGTYNARKREALIRAQVNERNDDIADGYRWIGDFTDNYSMYRQGDAYRVGLGDFVSARVIADWYETHSFEWIQDKRSHEEWREREMRTPTTYSAEELKRNEKIRRKIVKREWYAALKRMISGTILGLLSGIISGIIGVVVFFFVLSSFAEGHYVIFILLSFLMFWGIGYIAFDGAEGCENVGGLGVLAVFIFCYLLKKILPLNDTNIGLMSIVVGALIGVIVGRKIYTSR